jgi:arsenate reductase (thioredoxin)
MHTNRLEVSFLIVGTLVLLPSPSVLAQTVATRGVQDHTILFVCEHGSAKSVIAAAHFNDLAARTGSPYRAIARGLHPDTEIPPYVKRGLRAERLDIRGWQPKQFIERDALTADRVITLGCALPLSKALAADKLQDWDIPPPIENYQNASRSIVERVALLLKELAGKQTLQ